MELAQLDLNLLVVFQQLLRERRVSRVAVTLGLSQPAVSNALRRLRGLLDDELFLRTPAGMEPTPYAQQLAGPVAQALDTLRDALNVRASFDPSTSSRCFSLAMTDVGETYFLPVLMDALSQQAPGVTLRCVPVADATLRDDMAAGRVDLALGSLPQLQAGFFQQTLFRQRYVALMREGHPLAARGTVTAAAYRQAAHVRVVSTGTGHGQVEAALDRLGIARSVQLTLPHYVALGHVLGSTDLLATVPERFAERACAPFGLVARPLTLKLPGSTIAQLWHAHLHRDPGHQWLRGLVVRSFGTADAAATGTPGG
ncbi:MAG: LysR family transcriptional regulator [Hydrogenophaga sp.]|uniref:LysR family transcriptional regulator n=1 Tax=Hydrogenophaga sp. TaxID=1904254 RepID=UPI0025BAD5F7|nr:LysR family transcriptional regulator [Hydrogenophaga sp.]MBT9553044.1 LysR family transcriptional regulator [Hydrogenophaga sp.]